MLIKNFLGSIQIFKEKHDLEQKSKFHPVDINYFHFWIEKNDP